MPTVIEQRRPYLAESEITSSLPKSSYIIDYYNSSEAPLLQPQRKESYQEEFTQSIYESYNAFNEAERIQKLQHLSKEEQSYYISENIISYLEEFVGEIRIKKLAGVLKDDGSMEMLGTNVTDMYNNAASLAGPGSREYAEKAGLDTISQQLNQGNNRAIWISPPKLADYGFAFTFVVDDYNADLGGRPFREMLLRYDEVLHSMETSKAVHSSLVNRIGVDAPHSNSFQSDSDFLAHPIVYKHDEFKDIEAVYEYLDISPEDVRRSEEFRIQVTPIIKEYISQYTTIIQEMSKCDLELPNSTFKQLEQDANDIIGAIFNIARIIKRKMDISEVSEEKLQQDALQLQLLNRVSNREEMMMMARHMGQYEDLVIQGGSNCAVTKRSAGLFESEVLEGMNAGLSIGESMQSVDLTSSKKDFDGKCVNCPSCKKTVDAVVTNSKITCPKCKFEVKRN